MCSSQWVRVRDSVCSVVLQWVDYEIIISMDIHGEVLLFLDTS